MNWHTGRLPGERWKLERKIGKGELEIKGGKGWNWKGKVARKGTGKERQ